MPNQYTSPWTPEQDDVLYEGVGVKTYEKMAETLGRSVEAVKRRIERLGLEDKHVATGTVSARELALIVGVDPTTVIRRWIPDGLVGVQKKLERGVSKKHRPYFIYPEDFWKWAEKNKKRINFSKIERGVLIPEPDWFKEEWDKDFYIPNKTRKMWTDEEDDGVWKLYYEVGLPQKEIAEQMQRTQNSVEKRLKRLREKKITYKEEK